MSENSMSNSIRVGIFVTVCLAVLAYLIIKVEDFRFGGGGERVAAVFDTVVGLDDKAPVRVAGVRVGRVDGITLEGQRARVELLLDRPVELPQGSYASIANTGLLGDKYVQLVLGPAGGPPLAEDAVLRGETPVSFDEALGKLNDLGDSISELTGSFAEEDLAASIGRLVTNLEATSLEIRELVHANRSQVSSTIANLERFSETLAQQLPLLTEQMQQVLARVDGVVAENRGDLRESLENVRQLTERAQVSVDNLNSISSQIASGEGTLGKLVYDDGAHDSLVGALDSVEEGVGSLTQTLGRLNQIEFELGLEGTYFTEIEESRTAVAIDIDPEDTNRFYYVELVDDPRGNEERKTQIITTTLDDGSTETETIETVTIEDDFTISAQFGFRLGNADLRAGLFESSGGGAIDYYFLDRDLRISAEAFDFSRDGDLSPRLRVFGRYRFHPNIYLVGGYDDVLESDRASLFFGAGVRWKDDDLKYLLGSVPRF